MLVVSQSVLVQESAPFPLAPYHSCRLSTLRHAGFLTAGLEKNLIAACLCQPSQSLFYEHILCGLFGFKKDIFSSMHTICSKFPHIFKSSFISLYRNSCNKSFKYVFNLDYVNIVVCQLIVLSYQFVSSSYSSFLFIYHRLLYVAYNIDYKSLVI